MAPKSKPSIFMAKPKRSIQAKVAASAAPSRDTSQPATSITVDAPNAWEDATLSASEALLKKQLMSVCNGRRTKLVAVTATTLTFDDRGTSPPKVLQFDVPPLLQVGNFDEWWRKAEMMLISQGHFTISLKEADSSADTAFYSNGGEPARLLKQYIGKDVLSRVSAEALDHIHSLVPILCKITSAPFRILDLPAELRAHILEMALGKKQPIYLYAEAPENGETVVYKKGSNYQPAVCRASHQLRKEGMPILLKTNEFRFVHNMCNRAYPNALDAWSMANKRWLSSLRRLTVQVRRPMIESHHPIRLAMRLASVYTPDDGLRLDKPEEAFEASALPEVNGIVARLNSFAKANGLEGQLTTMFFAPPKMWHTYVPDVALSEEAGDADDIELWSRDAQR